MKVNIIFFILGFFILSFQNLYADSPLTSTDISNAYKKKEIIKLASKSDGKLTSEIINYLLDPINPIDVKVAVINELSWDSDGKNNSAIFFDYLKKKHNYKDVDDFIQRASSSNLICMAYLKALDNYFDVEEAIVYAQKAKQKNKKSYTINIITALIEAQNTMDSDWCEVFKLTDNVRSNKSLIMDMNKDAINIIFEYMDGYEEYCETTKLDINKDVYIESNEYRRTSYVFVGDKKLVSGEKTIIHYEPYGLTTSISIAKEGEKNMIIFWQETTDRTMNFFDEVWKGTVVLYLENGETISLIDRNKKGHNKIKNEESNFYGFQKDLYQRFSAYYLTTAECEKLKKSNLSQVGYKTTSVFEKGTTYLEVSTNKNTIKEQLLAIGR